MENHTDFISVYSTASNLEEAERIAKILVEKRLVACVNIIDNIRSIYWWEGEIQEDHEAVLIAKTKAKLFPEIVHKIKELHSYSVPAITSWPILAANPAYLEWIAKEAK
jgi:periplasmic divalent cation tolerance protein